MGRHVKTISNPATFNLRPAGLRPQQPSHINQSASICSRGMLVRGAEGAALTHTVFEARLCQLQQSLARAQMQRTLDTATLAELRKRYKVAQANVQQLRTQVCPRSHSCVTCKHSMESGL
jgi:hypothetical protein